MAKLRSVIFIFFGAKSVFADEIYVYPPEPARVAINQAVGSLVEFPYPIKVVADTAKFQVEMVPTEVTEDGSPVDVTIVKVTPKASSGGSIEEVVPFLLSGKRAVNLRFYLVDGAPKHQNVVLPKSSLKARRQANGATWGTSFLEKELTLMRLMLRDEEGEGFVRSSETHGSISLKEQQMDLSTLRRYEGHELLGFVFSIKNLAQVPVKLEAERFSLANPFHDAVLFHTDIEELTSCEKNERECTTLVHLVMRKRGQNHELPVSSMPFRIGSEEKK